MIAFQSVLSPVGDLTVFAEREAVIVLTWGRSGEQNPNKITKEAVRQLNAYFDQKLTAFDLPLRAEGSAFEKSVWNAMLEIPFGQTLSYGDIAADLETAAQPVGNACGTNPIPIIIPCHRVLAAGGKMGGFSGDGGVETKRALLVHEGALLA